MNSRYIFSSTFNDNFIDKTVSIRGRIFHKEFSNDNKNIFLYIRDDLNVITALFDCYSFPTVSKLTLETFIAINGILQQNKTPSLTKYIIIGSSFELLSLPSDEIEVLKTALPSIRFLYIRKPEIKTLLLLKRFIRKYCISFLEEKGFQPVETPVITSFTQINRQAMRVSANKKSNISEREKYLIQKSQFYLEAFSNIFGKVYSLTPAFRTDHRDSDLLLAEFWLIEVEEIFSDMHEKMNLLESLIKFMTKELLINHSQELKNLIIYRNLAKHPNNEFLKIHTLKTEFWENIEIEHEQQKKFLNKIIFKKNFPRLAYKDVNKEFQEKGEYFETSHLREKRGEYLTSLHDSPVFVTEFPFMTRHFYDKKHSENEIYTYTFDLIGHGGYGEIASGSEREYRADIVEAQMHEKKLRKDNNQTLQWYYKQQRFGSVPHAGFSIGLERMTAWLTQTGNIADIVGFPRRIVGNDINY